MSISRAVRLALGSALTAAALTFAPMADAANDVFLQLDGAQGESTDREFRDAIVVQDFSFGVSTGATNAGTAPGKPIFDLLTFTKRVDRSSVKLYTMAALGQSASTALLSTRRVGATQGSFFKVKLFDVSVAAIKISETNELTESVSLAFSKAEIEYFMQDEKGRVVPAGKAVWDVRRK